MVLSWGRENLGWMSGGSSLPREWWGAGTAAQGGCGCSIPGGVQCQVGWGPGQPGLVLNGDAGGPDCSRGVGASWSLRSLPTQAILWFHDEYRTRENYRMKKDGKTVLFAVSGFMSDVIPTQSNILHLKYLSTWFKWSQLWCKSNESFMLPIPTCRMLWVGKGFLHQTL